MGEGKLEENYISEGKTYHKSCGNSSVEVKCTTDKFISNFSEHSTKISIEGAVKILQFSLWLNSTIFSSLRNFYIHILTLKDILVCFHESSPGAAVELLTAL